MCWPKKTQHKNDIIMTNTQTHAHTSASNKPPVLLSQAEIRRIIAEMMG